MSREIQPDYSQTFLLPPALEDWVGADHPARFIRDFVEALDLKNLGFKQRKSKEGAPHYGADLLLKIWLYGYFRRIRSSRKLEEACRENMGAIWLAGRHTPDHNTIWRFWRDNRKPLRALLKRSIQVAANLGMVEMVLHAVDGTKILTAASRQSAWHRKDLEKALETLDRAVEEIMQETQSAQETGAQGGGWSMPEKLRGAQKRRVQIREALAKLERQGAERLHPHEPEARMMKVPASSRKEWAYNAQAVVESKNQLVVAAQTTNNASDTPSLNPMLEETKANLGAVAQSTLGDSAYGKSERQVAEAQAKQHHVLTNRPPGEEAPFHRSHFHFDRKTMTCRCPRAEKLRRDGGKQYPEHQGRTVKFRCVLGKDCPSAPKCFKGKTRSVEFSPYHEAMQRHRQESKSGEGKALLKSRGKIIEPVFGRIKRNEDFRRFTSGGLENTRTQWNLICLVHNLRILYRKWQEPGFGAWPGGSIRNLQSEPMAQPGAT